MKTETIQKIKELLINEGYEKELSSIYFLEDLDLEEIDFDFELLEPIEFEELI